MEFGRSRLGRGANGDAGTGTYRARLTPPGVGAAQVRKRRQWPLDPHPHRGKARLFGWREGAWALQGGGGIAWHRAALPPGWGGTRRTTYRRRIAPKPEPPGHAEIASIGWRLMSDPTLRTRAAHKEMESHDRTAHRGRYGHVLPGSIWLFTPCRERGGCDRLPETAARPATGCQGSTASSRHLADAASSMRRWLLTADSLATPCRSARR
jgi:hypothetical protein